jgi:hypothetical protein
VSDAYTLEDRKRLAPHNARVAAFMADAQWHTLAEICAALNIPNTGSAASRLRDLAASRLYNLERRRNKGSLHFYRLTPREQEQLPLLEGAWKP